MIRFDDSINRRFRGIEVRPRDGRLTDSDIRKLTKKVRDAGVMDDLRDRAQHPNRSDRRRLKDGRAAWKARKTAEIDD